MGAQRSRLTGPAVSAKGAGLTIVTPADDRMTSSALPRMLNQPNLRFPASAAQCAEPSAHTPSATGCC
jgi:hypothetical protein